MPWKSIIRSVVTILLVLSAYFVGEHRGLKKGVEISAIFTQSGRSIDQANMIALLLGYSRRGEEEKMYEWGEKFLVQNVEVYKNIQTALDKQSTPIKDTELFDLLDVMVNSYPASTTSHYIETYIKPGQRSGVKSGN